jgi:hypothetical protein
MLELLRGHQTGGDDLVGRCLDLCRGTSLEPALRLLVELIAYLAGLGSARY